MKEGERESWRRCPWAPQPEPAVQGSGRTSSGEQGWGHSKHTGAPSDSKLLWFEVNSRPVICKRSCADEGDGNMGGLGPVSPSSALAVGWVLNVLVQRRYKYPQCVNAWGRSRPAWPRTTSALPSQEAYMPDFEGRTEKSCAQVGVSGINSRAPRDHGSGQ